MDVQYVIPIQIIVLTVETSNISKIIFAILVRVTAFHAQMELYALIVQLVTCCYQMELVNIQTLMAVLNMILVQTV
jgi:hypothetical protein